MTGAVDGVLGIDAYIPAYGLWITTDPRCQAAVAGLVAEGYDFKLVYKWGCRSRETRLASQYLVDVAPGGLIHEAERRFDIGLRAGLGGDYIREVFVGYPTELVRCVNGIKCSVEMAGHVAGKRGNQ